jgi:hypothetical protein
MTAVPILPPTDAQPLVSEHGVLTVWGLRLLRALYDRLGGVIDKVDAAYELALAAVPQSTVIAAAGGLKTGGALSANVGVTLYAAMTSVALLPSVGNSPGDWAYALDGRKPGEGAGAGTGVPCFWSAGNWYAATSGAVVTS